jgi:hypothetical protein
MLSLFSRWFSRLSWTGYFKYINVMSSISCCFTYSSWIGWFTYIHVDFRVHIKQIAAPTSTWCNYFLAYFRVSRVFRLYPHDVIFALIFVINLDVILLLLALDVFVFVSVIMLNRVIQIYSDNLHHLTLISMVVLSLCSPDSYFSAFV